MKTYLILLLSILAFPAITICQQEVKNEIPFHEMQQEHPLFYEALNEYPKSEPDDFQGKFIHMLLVLAVVIAFMIIAAWALKNMTKTRQLNLNASSVIKVLETRQLSPRTTLYLITLNNQTVLLAETPSGMTHLALAPENTSISNSISKNFEETYNQTVA